jgi:hypothetical protein
MISTGSGLLCCNALQFQIEDLKAREWYSRLLPRRIVYYVALLHVLHVPRRYVYALVACQLRRERGRRYARDIVISTRP